MRGGELPVFQRLLGVLRGGRRRLRLRVGKPFLLERGDRLPEFLLLFEVVRELVVARRPRLEDGEVFLLRGEGVVVLLLVGRRLLGVRLGLARGGLGVALGLLVSPLLFLLGLLLVLVILGSRFLRLRLLLRVVGSDAELLQLRAPFVHADVVGRVVDALLIVRVLRLLQPVLGALVVGVERFRRFLGPLVRLGQRVRSGQLRGFLHQLLHQLHLHLQVRNFCGAGRIIVQSARLQPGEVVEFFLAGSKEIGEFLALGKLLLHGRGGLDLGQ